MMDLKAAKARLIAALRREIRDERILQAIEQVPREFFVPPSSQHLAYEDIPIPIGDGQTISQPYIVAMMTAALEVRDTDRILEIGTGSGYQATILAKLAQRVVTVERLPQLAEIARQTLESLGIHTVKVVPAGDALGCPEEGPFDGIIVTAGAPRLPPELLDQMALGARLVIPIGSRYEQELTKLVRTQDGHSVHTLGGCRFVPLIGPGAWPEEET